MQEQPRSSDSYADVQDIVLYELAPYLNRRGAHVWIAEVSRKRFVVGFTCWLDAERMTLRDWLHDRLRSALSRRVYDGVTVEDRSDWRPPVAFQPRVAMNA